MKLLVGLGNPGIKYENTRHNAGFLALDDFIAHHRDGQDKTESRTKNFQNNFQAKILEFWLAGKKTIVVKPQTFMNQSGRAVRQICNFYKIAIDKNLLIIHDDTDLAFGVIRPTDSSSSAGHNGVQDIIDSLGTKDIHRIRIGIETRPLPKKDAKIPTEAFVLQNFNAGELSELQKTIFPKVRMEIEKFLSNK